MATVKTAISLDPRLLKRVDRMAKRRGVSRSRLFAEAAERLLRHDDTDALVKAINRAARIPETEEERRTREGLRASFARIVEAQW